MHVCQHNTHSTFSQDLGGLERNMRCTMKSFKRCFCYFGWPWMILKNEELKSLIMEHAIPMSDVVIQWYLGRLNTGLSFTLSDIITDKHTLNLRWQCQQKCTTCSQQHPYIAKILHIANKMKGTQWFGPTKLINLVNRCKANKVLIFTNYPHRQNLNIGPQYTIRDKASSDSYIQDINDS